MKRKEFIKNSLLSSLAIPLTGNYGFKALGAYNALLNAINYPVIENDNVLVIVQLQGGNDGLNTVIPFENFSNYVNARKNIYIQEDKALTLSGTHNIGLNPALKGFQSLFNEGKLAIIQSVGYPQPNFSHFRATDIWMTGSDSDVVLETGWAGRYLDYQYPNFPISYPNASMPDPLAIQIGSITSLTLQGPSVSLGVSISSATNFYNLINDTTDPAPNTPAGKELTFIRQINQQTQSYSTRIKNAASNVATQVNYPSNSLADQLKIVARLIKGGLKTKVYMVSYGSFDTHANQVNSNDTSVGTHANLLKNISDSIKAFQDDLNFLGVADRVVGMTFSEFGRRILSNASGGTDHGAAAPCFIFGNKTIGSILGQTPFIPSSITVNDNLPYQYDFRSIYASLLVDWLCVDSNAVNQILLKNFQQLPLVNTSTCKISLPVTNANNLINNYPNPFNAFTNITYKSNGGHCMLQVLSGDGKVVATLIDAQIDNGFYTVQFKAGNIPAGLYYIRFQNGTNTAIRPILKF